MKRNLIYLILVSFVLLCSEFTQNVYGNAVVAPLVPKHPFISVPILIIMYFIGAWIEYAYFNSNIFGKEKLEDISRSDYKLFLKINLVTFPLTQIIAYFFYIYFLQFFWLYIFLIEIGVVFIESYLLRIESSKGENVLLSLKYIFINTFSANTISFLVGFLVYILI